MTHSHRLATPFSAYSATVKHLTCREFEVLQLLVTGRTNKEIAAEMVISGKTVEFHLHNLYSKIGVKTRTEVVIWALQNDLKLKN